MEFNEYQELTSRTENPLAPNDKLVEYAFGLAGEAGEVVDIIKKIVFHGHNAKNPLVIDHVGKELGDLMWYIARMAAQFNLKLEDVAEANIEKLKARYPDGFSQERSINRAE